MIVQGTEITDAQIEACLAFMKKPGTWYGTSVMRAASNAGVEWGPVAMRLADRLIQRERKAGNVRQVARGIWEWSGGHNG